MASSNPPVPAAALEALAAHYAEWAGEGDEFFLNEGPVREEFLMYAKNSITAVRRAGFQVVIRPRPKQKRK